MNRTPASPYAAGALRFARYAYPPNELGYCGPDASRQMLEQVAARVADPDLRRLIRGFEGAWPYLELIAEANGIADPLDDRVVEAYWLGNRLLDRVTPTFLGESMRSRFRDRAGGSWDRLAEAVCTGALPHHAFHVFGVYPWVGLLRSGRTTEPLRVLDRCRVRWGRVVALGEETAVVRSRPLAWDGRVLGLGEPIEETALVSSDGLDLAGPLAVGDWCSLHWEWVCERLDAAALGRLRRYTLAQLAVVNHPALEAPAHVLA